MPGVRDWIEEQLEKGVPKHEIRRLLEQKGYSKRAIDILEDMESPYEKELLQKRTKRKMLELAAAIIAVASLVIGGLYTYELVHIPTTEELALNLSQIYGNVAAMKVVGNSMSPTFKDGDIVFVALERYSNESITKNDVALIKLKLGEDPSMKRVAALPLEQIGLNENYLANTLLQKQLKYYDYVVPNGSLIVLGDNPDESIDSRQYGILPVQYAAGKVVS